MQVEAIGKRDAARIVSQYHYLGSKPFRASHCFGLIGQGGVKGACVFHGLSAPETAVGAFGLDRADQAGLFELGRLVLEPTLNGGNWGSFLVGRSLQALRKATTVRAVISYADSTYHNGAIYQACNFLYYGLTAPKSDYWIDGKISERGKTKGRDGEWRPRPRKHRYAIIYDKTIQMRWVAQSYPKR